MKSKWNALKSKKVELNEALREVFCPTCDAVGWIYEGGIRKICPTCEGEGKLDCIKRIIKGIRDIDHTIR